MIYIISDEGNSTIKLSWVVPILIFPVFGTLFYLFLTLQPGTRRINRRIEEVGTKLRPYLLQDPEVLAHYESISASGGNLVRYMNQYGRFPCKIKAGIFVLCVQGTVHATVNLTEFTIRKNDFVTLPPGCFIQIHEVSDDVKLCFAGFSSVFVSHINYIKTITNYLPVIFDSPIMPLPEHISLLYQQAFDLLINAYSMPKTIENKEIIKAVFTIYAI